MFGLSDSLIEAIAQQVSKDVASRHHADPDGHGACTCGEPPMTLEQWAEHVETETVAYMKGTQ